MKKIIYILVFAIILTSCNNEGTKGDFYKLNP